MTFEPWQWAVAFLAAALVGFSKTGISGLGMLFVVLFAHIMPAKQATGIVLPLLCFGDIVAVLSYRHHANWHHIRRVFPWAAAGVAANPHASVPATHATQMIARDRILNISRICLTIFRRTMVGANRLSIGCAIARNFGEGVKSAGYSLRPGCLIQLQRAAIELLMVSTSASSRPSSRSRSGPFLHCAAMARVFTTSRK